MATSGILHAKVAPDYLHTNSTSHIWAFSAIAELIDNAYDPDAKASELKIDRRYMNGKVCLTFTDNGNGMSPEKLHKMLSFGYCEKVAGKNKNHQPIGHYGNGFKSSSMRLGKDAIVFTRMRDVMSVGFLSQTYLKAVKAETVLVPILSWDLPNKTRRDTTDSKQNLDAICTHSIFETEEELMIEFESMEKHITGTKIIIYNLARIENNLELDFESDRLDIRNPETQSIDNSTKNRVIQDRSPEYKVSLREYCSILYLKPKMKIVLRGKKVKTILISKSLSETETDFYKPTWLEKSVRITFGFTSSKHPEDYGLMMYHRNRLIRAYEKIGYQKQANQLGVAVVGLVEVSFLTPTHNKQDFNRDANYNGLVTNIGSKLNDYWNAKRGGVSTASHTVISPDRWVQCDNCLKWRRLPTGVRDDDLPDKWFCYMNPDAPFNRCEVAEELEDELEVLMGPTCTYKKKRNVNKKKRPCDSTGEIIPNPDQEKENPEVDLPKESDEKTESGGPSSSKKSKKDNPSNGSKSQANPGNKASDSEEPETVETYKERLRLFKENVHEMLGVLHPDKDWGDPENLEEFVRLWRQVRRIETI